MLPTLRQRSCTHGTLTLFILILAVVSLVNCLAFISTSLAATTSLPPSSPFRNRCTHDMGRCFVKRGGIEVWERCGRRKGNVGTWAQWGGKAAGVAARTTTRMISYNPNDELRAIVQRKQLEVENLLATHTADDDRLQVSARFEKDRNALESFIPHASLRHALLDPQRWTARVVAYFTQHLCYK